MSRRALSRILAMPLAEVMGRTRQELGKLRDRALPPEAVFRGSLGPHVRGTVPATLTGLADPAACAAWCHAHDPDGVRERVRRADRMMAGEIPLLGLGWLPVGSPPDWTRDPVSGMRAPDLPWSRIDYLNAASVGDSKAVWELNRHQYLLTVAQVYRLTGDPRHRTHVWETIRNWIEGNPLGVGVNWSSSLEVAFRAVSWSWLWHLADGREALGPAEAARFLRVLEWHGLHVERYLSTWFSPNTHLTGEALGLCALASFWPEAARAERWWRTGADILDAELLRQVGADGFHMERSACYHRYTVDFYLHYLLLQRARGDRPREGLETGVRRMVDALARLRRPDGRLVAVGDEDGGRFLPLWDVEPLEPGATLLLAAAVLGRGAPPEGASARWELVWMLGPEAVPPPQESAGTGPTVHVLEDAGFATLRAAGDFAFVSAGIQREGRDCTGHVHDDAMSIELWLHGAGVVVDPGTFSYTGDRELRAWYRGSAAHSVVLPAHQARPSTDRPFGWERLRTAAFGAAGAGATHGYVSLRCPLDGGMVHHRLVVWGQGRGWLIWDRVRGPSRADVTARYQLMPGSPVAERGDGVVALGTCRILLVGPLVRGGIGELVRSDVSPVYGRAVPATAWEARGTHALPVDGVTLVRPSSERSCTVRTRVTSTDNGLHRVLRVGPRGGERIGLSEATGTDIADPTCPGPVRLRWVGADLQPLDLRLPAGHSEEAGQDGGAPRNPPSTTRGGDPHLGSTP